MKIYNTLSKKKETFNPLQDKRVNIFVCGITTYDLSHIGHARTYVAFDAFVKYLRQKDYNVFYLQNITDIDDKIIIRAKKEKLDPESLSLKYEKEYLRDMKELKINSVTKYAKATDYIKEISNQVKQLIDKGYAYTTKDGIYYNISKFKRYGKLSGRTKEQAEDAISRIDQTTEKKNKGDFCLWKFAKKDEPSWKSTLGTGRPGWHIEDTAISEKFFGYQYDIHGGARDLIFPHHEAEIAQIEAVSNKSPMVKYWMHTGFLTIDGQKMSKSLGNFITIKDFLKKHSSQELRFTILKNLWHSPIDYTQKTILETQTSLQKIKDFLIRIKEIKNKQENKQFTKILEKHEKDFYYHLDDNFNTPKAFSIIFNLIKKTNTLIDKNTLSKKDAKQIESFFKKINEVFEIIDFKNLKKGKIPQEIKKLIKKRNQFRKKQDWKQSDIIRKKIEKQGYTIEDTPQGTTIK